MVTDEDKALVERLRGDWPEILVEKHWMMDSDAIDMQREEAADRIEAQAAEIEKLEKAIKVQASAVRTLQANEETEINILRQQKREWHQAVSSLDSEREANAILTAEIEKLRMHLDVALETLAEEGVCGDECNSCKEARAALGEPK
jgi:chromosome segregation ATPase